MESNAPQNPTKRLTSILRAIYYLLLKGCSKAHFLPNLDLPLLLRRSAKLAGIPFSYLLSPSSHRRLRPHQHYHATSSSDYLSALSCRSLDPTTSVYEPRRREVEFSCSNTPSFSFLKHRSKNGITRHRRRDSDAEAVQKMLFEMLNEDQDDQLMNDEGEVGSMTASPSPWVYERSPAVAVRQLRVSDSPYPIEEEEEQEEMNGGKWAVDREAEEFIRRFREQLRLQAQQQMMVAMKPRYVSRWEK